MLSSISIANIPIHYNVSELIELFYVYNIATIREITYYPVNKKGEVYNNAVLQLHEWHDTEIAYNFIGKLKRNGFARIVYDNDDNYFIVKLADTEEVSTQCHTIVNYLATDYEVHPYDDSELLYPNISHKDDGEMYDVYTSENGAIIRCLRMTSFSKMHDKELERLVYL
jgi:hypothetical protein